MKPESIIYIAGRSGLVGQALEKNLKFRGYKNIVGPKSRKELDLKDRDSVDEYFCKVRPEIVIIAAAEVGGIVANSTRPVDFLYNNLQIQNNLITLSYEYHVEKLLFIGSSCIYPRKPKIPITEDQLLSSPLEKTNQAYALAKICGLELCRAYNQQYKTNYISAMPTNLLGPGDNFDPIQSHVIPGMIQKFHDAKINNRDSVTLWGTGQPLREFMFSEDAADAMVYLLENYNSSEIVNIGTGIEISIRDAAEIVKKVVGFAGQIVWDTSKPDGTPRKLLDITKLKSLGYNREPTDLKTAIEISYKWALENQKI